MSGLRCQVGDIAIIVGPLAFYPEVIGRVCTVLRASEFSDSDWDIEIPGVNPPNPFYDWRIDDFQLKPLRGDPDAPKKHRGDEVTA